MNLLNYPFSDPSLLENKTHPYHFFDYVMSYIFRKYSFYIILLLNYILAVLLLDYDLLLSNYK